MTCRRRSLAASLVLAAALGTVAIGAASLPGPPIACHPISIGDARSLPMENGKPSRKYTPAQLVSEVAGILKAETNPMVHMETLRRAAAYVFAAGSGNVQRGVAWEILCRLIAQAAEQDLEDKDSSLSWMDAGFLIAACEQTGVSLDLRAGLRDGIEGYAYVAHAVEVARKYGNGNIGEIEYAAALLTIPVMRPSGRTAEQKQSDQALYDGHVRRAALAAKPGSLLETNLAAHLSNWGGSLEKVRAQAKTQETTDATARR